MSVVTTMLLWRLYTYRASELLPAAIAATADPGHLVRRVLAAHLIMVVGIMAISAGIELVIEQPVGRTKPEWLTYILGGPALFIIGRAAFEQAVFAHISWHRVIGLVVLIAPAPVMVFVPPLAVAATAATVLAGIAIADVALQHRPFAFFRRERARPS